MSMRSKHLLLTFLLSILTIGSLKAQFARVQVINNTGDAMLQLLDVYMNGNLVVDDLAFRNSSMFFDVNISGPVEIGIGLNTSLTINDTFYSQTANLVASSIYIIVLNGIESTSGYSPATPFSAHIYNMGRESATNPINTDLIFMHGATDYGIVDVRGNLDIYANDISYGNFSNYNEIFTNDMKIRLTNTIGNVINQTYDAPLSSLGMGNLAGVVCFSGFVNTANNSNGPSMGLWLASSNGGPLTELPITDHEALARVQLIHNSADTTADTVDVYYMGEKVLDDFAYLTATPYMDVYGNTPSIVAVAPANSTSINDTFYSTTITFDSAKTYSIVAHGIESDTNYKPLVPFMLSSYNNAKEVSASPTTTEILAMHGSTDAPTIDIVQATNTLFNNINYSFFSNGYASLNTQNYIFDLTDAGGQLIESYEANLSSWSMQGQTGTLVSTGFIEPDSNSQGPSIGLYMAMSEGGPLVKLPVAVSVNNLAKTNQQINLWPNPTTTTLHIGDINTGTARVFDITGKQVLFATITNNEINVSDLPSGTYIINVFDGEITSYGKFVKY